MRDAISASTGLASSPIVAFVATSQPERARAFYEQVLGLHLMSDEPYALVFQVGGTTLRIQKTNVVQPPPYTTLGWQVQDITATARELIGQGVTFERFESMEQDDLGIWSSPSGARVAWFKDPDGNLLSLTQPGVSRE